MAETYRVVIEDIAENQLDEIVLYLYENVSADTALNVQDGILDAVDGLSFMPMRHSIVHDISDEITIYRRVLQWSYRIIFHIDEENQEVTVVNISHSHRDPQWLIDLFKK